MIKFDDILNKKIITVKEGRQFNKITEILIDKSQYELRYILIGNLEKSLNFTDITSIGENNIVIQSEEKLQDINSINKENLIEYGNLKKLKIISEKGLEIGKIQAVYAKEENGKISHYEIASTPVSEHRILSQEGILSLGQDVIIISEAAVEVSQMMKSRTGFMNILKKLFVGTKKTSENTKEKIEEVSGNIGKKAGEVIEKAKPKIEKVTEKMKDIIKKDKSDKQE